MTRQVGGDKIINTMNELATTASNKLMRYQTERLQDLIREMIHCCEDRRFYETKRFGLPHAEIKCLMEFNGGRYLTVKGIAQSLDVTKSRVTKIVEGLVEKGLVEHMHDPRDGRIKLISLTGAGRKKSEEVRAFQKGIHERILLQLDPDQRKSVLSSLESLRSAMEAVKEQLV